MVDKKRIERLAQVRERLLDARKMELAAADAELRRAEELQAEARRIEEGAVQALMSDGVVSGAELQHAAILALKAVAKTSEATLVVAERAHDREDRQLEVFQAKKDVKVLEALEARIVDRIRVDERRREQSAMDEAAARARETRDEARSGVDNDSSRNTTDGRTGPRHR